MAEQLVIYLNDIHSLSSDWIFTSETGDVTTPLSSGTIAELVEKNKNSLTSLKNVICIINSELVHLSFQNIPAKSKQRALQAIPFILEDQLAEEIEQLHFAASNAENNVYPVAAIRHEFMQSLLSNLAEFNISPSAVYADISCLPQKANCWNILNSKSGICIDQHTDSIIHTDADFFPDIIKRLLKKADKAQCPDSVSIWSATDAAELTLAENMSENINIIQYEYDTSPIVHFLKMNNNKSLINLLQGPYKVVSHSSHWWKVWRVAAILGAVAIVLELVLGTVQLNKLTSHNELLEAEITNIYKKSFPRSKRIVNARVQMENKLKQLRKGKSKGAASFTDILLDTSPVLQATPGITIQAINYNNNKLQLSFSIDKLSSVESLKQRLNKLHNIKAELISSSSEAQQVNAQISIEVI